MSNPINETVNKEILSESLNVEGVGVIPSALSMFAISESKGITIQSLAIFASIPLGNLEKFFNGNKDAVSEDSKWKIAEILGFNKKGFLCSDSVHFICLDRLTGSKEIRFKKMKSIGSLIAPARAAIVKLPISSLIKQPVTSIDLRTFFVVQNSDVRVLFSGSLDLHFKLRSADWQDGPAFIDQCAWAGGSFQKSVVRIMTPGNIRRIRSMDMTPIEFDNLFSEGKAATWEDADVIARKAGISAEEVIHWIETVGRNRTQGTDVPVELRVVRNVGIGEIQKRNVS